MEIGERIKIIREWQGLTAAKLARKTGCTASSISQYETGKRTPTLNQFRKLCKALQVPFAMLLEGVTLPDDPKETELED